MASEDDDKALHMIVTKKEEEALGGVAGPVRGLQQRVESSTSDVSEQGMRGCRTRARGRITTQNLPPDHHLLKNSAVSRKRLVSSRDAGGRTAADDAELTHTEDFVGQSAASGKRPV